MDTTKEKVSYCIGLQTGMNLKQQFADIDFDCLNNGLKDALTNTPPKLKMEEVQSILLTLRKQIEKQHREFLTKLSEENKKKSEAFLNMNKQKENVVTLSSGLQYKIIQKGPGTGPHPTLLDNVKIHYRGSFTDGRVFDSSIQRGEPVKLAVNRVIPGWSEVLQLMHVGDKWEVYIPPYLAYGETGFGPEIGPNTALIFEIELLGINEAQ